jgi:radical SAM superfamily enzyme YgiQ (UPF0313 family)
MRYKLAHPSNLSVSDFPTGIAYIASSLKMAGHEVVGLNLNDIPGYGSAEAMVKNEIQEAVKRHKPDMIGVGGIVTDYHFIRDAINVIREVSKVPIVLGGGIITHDADFIFKYLKPDYGIVGEAEKAFVQITNGMPLDTINNLWYWQDGKPIFTRLNYDYGNVDALPFPDYEPFGIQRMLDGHSHATRLLYRYTRSNPRPMVIVTARGCPFNCSFCIHEGNRTYRERSIENIMAEIKENYERYEFNILIIVDELFAVNKQRMDTFSNAILDGKAKYGWDFDWMFQTHANAKLDLESLKLAKQAGCYFFSYGLESASPTVLKSMNKHTKVPQIIEVIQLPREAKIGFGGNLIFGDPAETEKTIYETLDFYTDYCRNAFVFLSLIMPYPGARIFDYCLKQRIIQNREKYYDIIGMPGHYFNMTKISNDEWLQWVYFIEKMERSWLLVNKVNASSIVKGDKYLHTIEAGCPECGAQNEYKEQFDLNSPGRHFLGTGCKSCNQKIRIDLDKSKVREMVCL